jgi:hypothetical protein
MRSWRSTSIPVREAISAFLDRCQREAQPFATAEALGAIRTLFPELDISDADLVRAISSQADTEGFAIEKTRQAGEEE